MAAAYALLGISSGMSLQPELVFAQCGESIRIYRDLPFEGLPEPDRRIHRAFYWSAHNTRAVLLDDLGRLRESVAEHRVALALAESTSYDRGIIVSTANLSHQLLRSGDGTEALFQALRYRPDDFPGYADLFVELHQGAVAYAYFGSGMLDAALNHLRAAYGGLEAGDRQDDLAALSQLAYLEAAVGDIDTASRIIDGIDSGDLDHHSPRVASALAAAKARLLAGQGRFEAALEVLDQFDRHQTPSSAFEDIANPITARTEVLLLAGRPDEALLLTGGELEHLGILTESRLRFLRAKAFAAANRWGEALEAGRVAESLRRRLQLDPERYVGLYYPDGVDNAERLRTPAIASLYGRPVRLRDLLAHDMRGLLNSVQLAFEAATFEKDVRRYRTRLEQLISLIDALYDVPVNTASYLQLVDGSTTATLRPVRLTELADQLVERYSLQAERKGVQLVEQPSPDVDVLADPEMLQACLANLISNGLKFSKREQTVRLGWTLIDDNGGTGRPAVEISVIDQGPGLTSEEQRQIFGRPSSFSAQPTAGEPSTGLGLQIVYGFVDRMGGRVRADHNPGGGCRFVITLTCLGPASPSVTVTPRMSPPSANNLTNDVFDRREADETPPTAVTPNRERAGDVERRSDAAILNALVVDDDPSVVAVLAELIRSTGIEVVTATGYDDAYTIMADGEPLDLVIFDVMMDGAPVGFDLVRRARVLHPRAKIVVITGLGDVSGDEAFVDCQVLRKPVRFEQIKDLVDRTAAGIEGPKPTPASMTAAERSQLLIEVIHGRTLSIDVLADLQSAVDPTARAEGLTIAGVHEAIRGHLQHSLTLGRRAERDIVDSGAAPRVEFIWQVRNNMGIVLRELGRLDEARQQLEATLTYAQTVGYKYGLPRTALNLANVYDQLGLHDEATETLAWATNQVGADQRARAQLLAALGRLLFRHGEVNLAIAQFRRSLSNLSPLEVEDTRITLRWLVEAYLEVADHDSARVVLSRLERIDDEDALSPIDFAFTQSIRAALALADGVPELALDQARLAMNVISSEQVVEFSVIPIQVMVSALARLNRHAEVIDTWNAHKDVAVVAISTPTLLVVANSFEQLGRTRDAFELEDRAYRIRSWRNLRLHTVVALAQEMAMSLLSDQAATDELAPEDHATLWEPTNALLESIRDLRSITVGLLHDADRGDRSAEATVGRKITEVERAVVGFDAEAFEPSVEPVGTGNRH